MDVFELIKIHPAFFGNNYGGSQYLVFAGAGTATMYWGWEKERPYLRMY
jgi:hypothetical protein